MKKNIKSERLVESFRKPIKSAKRKSIVSAPRFDDGQLEFDFDENDEEDKEYMNKEYTQGEFDFDSVDAPDFDPNGNLESWFEEYVPPSGISETVGGEIVRAAMRILYRSYNDGDQIGRGYGKETVNPAARYLVDKLDGMQIVRDIENQLNHTDLYSETDYETWLQGPFTGEVETFLKENPQLFKQKNDEDMFDFGEKNDRDSRPFEIYLEDSNGIKYYFQSNGNEYKCYSVEGDGPEYEVGETVSFGDLDFDEDDQYPIAADNNGYAIKLEAVGDPDEDGNYSEWEVTDTYIDESEFDEGSTLSIDDVIGYAEDAWSGYTVYDAASWDEVDPEDLY